MQKIDYVDPDIHATKNYKTNVFILYEKKKYAIYITSYYESPHTNVGSCQNQCLTQELQLIFRLETQMNHNTRRLICPL